VSALGVEGGRVREAPLVPGTLFRASHEGSSSLPREPKPNFLFEACFARTTSNSGRRSRETEEARAKLARQQVKRERAGLPSEGSWVAACARALPTSAWLHGTLARRTYRGRGTAPSPAIEAPPRTRHRSSAPARPREPPRQQHPPLRSTSAASESLRIRVRHALISWPSQASLCPARGTRSRRRHDDGDQRAIRRRGRAHAARQMADWQIGK
jgi:hypothetical protein